jgi:primary-amine oxidase
LPINPANPFRREAYTSFYDYSKPGMTEAIVDLNAGKVISVKNIPNVIGMGLDADSARGRNHRA